MAPVAAKRATVRKPPANRRKARDTGDSGNNNSDHAASPDETTAARASLPRRSMRRSSAVSATAALQADAAQPEKPEKLSIRISRPQEDEDESAPQDEPLNDTTAASRSREQTDSPSAQLAGAVRRHPSPIVLLPQRPPPSSLPRSPLSSAYPSRSPSVAAAPASRGPSPPSRSPTSRPRFHTRAPSPARAPSSPSSPSSHPRSPHSPCSSRSSSPRSPSSPSYSRGGSRPPTSPPHANGTAAPSRRRRRHRTKDGGQATAKDGTDDSDGMTAAARPRYRAVLAMRGHAGPVAQVRLSPDGRWIASASADGTARIWDAATGAHVSTLVGHMAGLSCVAWSPDSNTLATGSDDKAIRLWDRLTAEPAHGGGGGGDAGLTTEPPFAAAAAGPGTDDDAGSADDRDRDAGPNSGGGTVRGTRLPLLGHHNYVYCLAFSPKGNMLASGSYDEAVFLWDVRAGRLMRSLPAHSDPVSGIDFCCDGTLVVSCSTDGLIRVWDTATGQCLRTLLLLNEDNPAVANVCFSPNGRYVLAFNLDSCIRLWDYVAQPSIVKKTYQGHRNTGFSIGGCFGVLPDTRGRAKKRQNKPFVAAASEDGDVVLWDVGTKAVVQRLRGAHRGGVCFWVDVCGATMVSCGQDGWINVYRHEEEEEGEEEEDEGEEEEGEEDDDEGEGGELEEEGSGPAETDLMDQDMDEGVVPEASVGVGNVDVDILDEDDDDEVVGVAMDLVDEEGTVAESLL